MPSNRRFFLDTTALMKHYQLASAMLYHERTPLDAVVAADGRLLRLAKDNSLPRLDPERDYHPGGSQNQPD
jgi:hypothetical protein